MKDKYIRVKILDGEPGEEGTVIVVLFSRDAYFKIAKQEEQERHCFNQTAWDEPLRRLYEWAVYYKYFVGRLDAVTYLGRFGL